VSVAEVTQELLSLYCQQPPEAIEGDGSLLLAHFNVPDRKALLAIDGYEEAFDRVSERAAAVRSLAARHTDASAQARESVRLLRDMLDSGESAESRQVTRHFVECLLHPHWPGEVQAWYARKVCILEWRDFFISYTDRDAMVLNQQFRPLITSCLGVFPKGNDLQTNQVARVITRHLRRYQGLRGFFAETDLKPGELIKAGLEGYCENAFALVQLIEPLTFDQEPPRNWCHYEYRRFTDNPAVVSLGLGRDRHFFIMTERDFDTLAPANPASAQREWHQRIRALKQTHIGLPLERNSTLRTKIKDVATQILTLRREIIDAWLAS
jgi:hypothetical protein